MTVRVEPINILTYIAHFNGALPPLAGYYAAQCAAKDSGLLLGAYMDGTPCGIAVTDCGGTWLEVVYIAVCEQYRKMGVCGETLRECIERAQTLGKKSVRLKYAPESSGDYLDAYLKKSGFQSRPHLITTVIPVNDSVKSEWGVFMTERGESLKRLTEKGFSAKSYAETPQEVLEKLFSGMGESFPGALDPRRCPNPMLENNSFVTIRDGSPAAYCIVTSADGGQTAIIEYMAASKCYIGKGAYLPCLTAAVESLLMGGVCAKIAFAYDADNKRLPKIAKDGAWFQGKTVKTMYSYYCELNP